MGDETGGETLLLMGRVWRAHGLRGELKVIPETDDPGRFEDLPVVYVGRTPGAAEVAEVEGVRFQPAKKGTLVILKLEGVDTREEAEAMRDVMLYARLDDVPPLEEGEYFLHDLIGLRAVLEDGGEIGVVESVLELPAQELLVIARSGRKPAMVPAVSEFVIDINLEGGTVVIRPIEGLLDE